MVECLIERGAIVDIQDDGESGCVEREGSVVNARLVRMPSV